MFAISARSRQHQPANSPSASTGRVTPGPEDLRVSHRPGTPSQLRRSAIDLLPQRDAGSIFLDSLSVARELGGMSPDASGRPQSQPWYLFPAPETLYGARPPETAAKQAPAAHIAASLCQVPPHRCECHSSATRPGSVPCFIFEKTPSPGAPLRNRTVDLLLTIYPRVDAVAICDDAGQVRGGARCCRPPIYLVITRSPGGPDAAPTGGHPSCSLPDLRSRRPARRASRAQWPAARAPRC